MLRELAAAVKAGVDLDPDVCAAAERLAQRAAKPMQVSASAFWPNPR